METPESQAGDRVRRSIPAPMTTNPGQITRGRSKGGGFSRLRAVVMAQDWITPKWPAVKPIKQAERKEKEDAREREGKGSNSIYREGFRGGVGRGRGRGRREKNMEE